MTHFWLVKFRQKFPGELCSSHNEAELARKNLYPLWSSPLFLLRTQIRWLEVQQPSWDREATSQRTKATVLRMAMQGENRYLRKQLPTSGFHVR